MGDCCTYIQEVASEQCITCCDKTCFFLTKKVPAAIHYAGKSTQCVFGVTLPANCGRLSHWLGRNAAYAHITVATNLLKMEYRSKKQLAAASLRITLTSGDEDEIEEAELALAAAIKERDIVLDACLKFWEGCHQEGIEGRRTKVWRDKQLFNTEKQLETQEFMESWYESWGETLPEAAQRWEELCEDLEHRIEELEQDPPSKRPDDSWFGHDYPAAGRHDAAHTYEVDQADEALTSLAALISRRRADEMEPEELQYQSTHDTPWYPIGGDDWDALD